MTELLPSVLADHLRSGLSQYLTTSFALADDQTRDSLDDFLGNSQSGIFRGPYVRLRLPFRPADNGWQRLLTWKLEYEPYGHQAAAFERLSSASGERPQPTIVTTGTGSGKTESFLYPILDHVVRANRAGESGIKALILYPMNALANDQAKRLTELITGVPELAGVRAAIYTGQKDDKRTRVSSAGLINDRSVIREDPPDILLTNYKMLDQLLLRNDDAPLWRESATSLQYLVLDEFHTYDGAQGTDVAMLLRRLGLALKSYWRDDEVGITDADRSRPLGKITPVATSATLGDKRDPSAILGFARTVFGEDIDGSALVTETRLSVGDWVEPHLRRTGDLGLEPTPIANLNLETIARLSRGAMTEPHTFALDSINALYEFSDGFPALTESDAVSAVIAHPLTSRLAELASDAVSIDDLARFALPMQPLESRRARRDFEVRVGAVRSHLALLSQLRATAGRGAASVDLHLWVREVTRLDRSASRAPHFAWSDDGPLDGDPDHYATPYFPAIYCRHCGRSGWGVQLAPTGSALEASDVNIRRNHAQGEARFRALISADREAAERDHTEGLHWFDVENRSIDGGEERHRDDSEVLPVLMFTGHDADEFSKDDRCPSCGQRDGIRFLGSSVATLLSVTLSNLFGTAELDVREKKALVFTDSVQDAAHRAGFVQSRSHALALRSVIRQALGDRRLTLTELADAAIAEAETDVFKRYQLLPPDLVDRDGFRPFWEDPEGARRSTAVRRRVQRRTLFDVSLEFGLQSRVGRTLGLTGTVVAEVDAGPAPRLQRMAERALRDFDMSAPLGSNGPQSADLVRWVRGTLEHLRERGAIDHPWLVRYRQTDGSRWAVWGGRPKDEGMPAFPKTREAPAFARIGSSGKAENDNLDVVTSAQSWYARWTAKCLGIAPGEGAKAARLLLTTLADEDVLTVVNSDAGAQVYGLPAERIVVEAAAGDRLGAGEHMLICGTCGTRTPGTAETVVQLVDGPCTLARCTGALERLEVETNYYRELYTGSVMRRIVAREHTGLLEDPIRLQYEEGFKKKDPAPSDPNVLVATPTLEMGIDIGDLSAVLLASLPKTVASYLQRVGRAGRLTGNSLIFAFVTGRGEHLPRLGDPLSVINGAVRPPATYLNATEILQRQYVASLVDAFARDDRRRHPRTARGAIASTAPDTFLGDLLDLARKEATTRLDHFLSAFPLLTEDVRTGLTDWASSEPGQASGVEALLTTASQRWNTALSELSFRKKALQDALPELEARANLPGPDDADVRAFRSAKATLGLISHQIGEMTGEHWVGVLEAYGVLPNYTLLDDSVSLDVTISWIDPDTASYETDTTTIERGASAALSELAPGSTFYARGMEVRIDAIDLGPQGGHVRTRIFCPSCGYSVEWNEESGDKAPTACPRCESKGIADLGQRLHVVELEKVSAELRRDESAISDSRDDRVRERYTIVPTVDLRSDAIERQWFVEGKDFGIKYLREVDIRWINLGSASSHGNRKLVAGEERSAPSFRVCGYCGKLDRQARSNSVDEHRAWCTYRKSSKEDVKTIVLSRTLRTQGALFRLPKFLTYGDPFVIPSLSAALLLGLREVLGGAPDHIDVLSTQDPAGGDGGTVEALLLHDIVPGGTGYLAEFADPRLVWSVLHRAWQIVRECECRGENRLACHRCLLPLAPGGSVDRVSRASAERSLDLLLRPDSDSDLEPDFDEWTTTETAPNGEDPESFLEQLFRQRFVERITGMGAHVEIQPGHHGNSVRFSLSTAKRTWQLIPQLHHGHTVPDFTLRTTDPNVPDVAIYTDGRRFHATSHINRVADDAAKRATLREMGVVVLAVTLPDLLDAEAKSQRFPDWWGSDVRPQVAQRFNLANAVTDLVGVDVMTDLMSWIEAPDADARKALARAVPWAMTTMSDLRKVAEGITAGQVALDVLAGVESAAGPTSACVYRRGDFVAAFVMPTSGTPLTAQVDVACVLNDSGGSLDADGGESWRAWLRLSNLLGWRVPEQPLEITTSSELAAAKPGAGTAVPTVILPLEWESILALTATGEERDFAIALAQAGGVPLPEVGIEFGDGIPLAFAWTDLKIAVESSLTEDDQDDLAAAGWTVLPMKYSDVVAALQREEA